MFIECNFLQKYKQGEWLMVNNIGSRLAWEECNNVIKLKHVWLIKPVCTTRFWKTLRGLDLVLTCIGKCRSSKYHEKIYCLRCPAMELRATRRYQNDKVCSNEKYYSDLILPYKNINNGVISRKAAWSQVSQIVCFPNVTVVWIKYYQIC